jgi:DNA-binding CsgD family transcriptional regulator
MKHSVQLAHIRQLCCLGIPGQTLMPALLRALREFVNADSAGFFWVDASGNMTNLYADRMLPPGLMKLYFERHYDGPEFPFRQSFLHRASAAEPVSSGSPSAALLRTTYYNEILRHLDAHHTMYAVIRDQGDALGQLSLYRARNAPAFTATERTAIRDISRYVAHAVNRPAELSAQGQFVDCDDEGMVIVDARCTIVRATASSLNLLSMATRREFSPRMPPLVAGDDTPEIVRRLIDRVRQIGVGGVAAAPREHVDGPWGRFLLSAYTLDETGGTEPVQLGIHIRRKQPMLVKLAEAMGALELSPQQREVALLLAQGKSNQEIGAALNVSNNTASYHIKQLFLRLDAHDRAEAVSRLLDQP